MTRTVSIDLDDRRAAELERLALDNGVSVNELINEAIDMLALERAQLELPPLTEDEQAKIDHAIAQADAGQVVSQDTVEARFAQRFDK